MTACQYDLVKVLKLYWTYIWETSENRTFHNSNANNNKGRFDSTRRGNSNCNNRNTRQRRYYNNKSTGNQTVENKHKRWCKALKCVICQSIYHYFTECSHRIEEDSEKENKKSWAYLQVSHTSLI